MNDLVKKYGFLNVKYHRVCRHKTNRTKQTAKEIKTDEFICLFSSTVSKFSMDDETKDIRQCEKKICAGIGLRSQDIYI
jgi:hypothetical protein